MIAGSVLTQLQRLMVLDTPLAPDVLLISSFTASEAMSNLFHYEIDMVAEGSKAPGVKAKNLIGEKCTVHLSLNSDYLTGPRRHFNGIVSRFTQSHADRRFVHYRAEVVPWLWLLTLSHDSRIFQDLSTLEIVKLLFDELKGQFPDLVAYRDGTTKTYTKLDYCVQYRESGFNFVSRLLEQDGIFYFFEHEKDKHTLVLADAPSIHKPCPNQATATYLPESGWGEFDNPVTSWEINNELRPGKYTLRDFHMQMPSKTLEVLEPTKFDVGNNGNLEVYDYPGEYARRFNKKERQGEVESEATKLVKMRMEAEETTYEQIHAASLCRGFTPGFNFKLNGHFDRGVNAKYVLTSIEHVAVQSPWYIAEEADKQSDEPYRNTFTAIPDDVPFRPARKTRKPVVPGTQTAIVVGPSGEEIWTDEFSRIKVQFHWDRKGNKDDKSSCWIRVSQPWAGQGWGSVSVPRIGQEVVVDFLEGDPDQPIVMGKVYNQELMPPYPLPKQGMVSGLKSNSTPGGGGYNEMSMDDTKGKEKITIHAQYDMGTTVEHDDSQTVHNNRTIGVDGTHTETIKKDTTITVTEGKEVNTVNQQIEVTSQTAHIHLTASTQIKLEVGASKLLMKSDGSIELSGVNIAIDGSQKVRIHSMEIASEADVQHQTKGTIVVSEGTATNTVKGAMVMLNP
jgi:type VI secretion system secreted protein VgrG